MKAKSIEAVYPLSPMQQGMLFHSIYEFNPELYFQQYSYTLTGKLNLRAFKRAWQQLVERHPILRTAFVWERLDDPLQVVGRRATLPFERHDWRTLSPEAQSAALDTLMRDDRNRGFDLSKAPLMRLHLIQLRDRAFRFIWSFHHILIDGWSMYQILGEAFRYYDAFCRGMELKLDPSRPYQDYIVWLQEQDLAATEQFWRETLRGFSQPTSLGVEYGLEPQAAPAERYAQQEFVIPASVTEELRQLARRHQVTMNTLMQGAWALLLSKYSGDEDVLFGAVVSGRPSDLEGVEEIAGLFINTLPVRVRFSSDARLLPCLEALQSAQIEARQYAYCPLARIQSWSEVDRGRPLFDTIMAFENLPLHSSPDENYGGLEIQGESIYGSTNYPISLAVDPGPELLIAVGYDRRRFDARAITQIVAHFQTLLANISAHPESRVSELQLMTASERERLLVDWNRTTRDYPRQASIASLFELEAEAHPERVALVYGDQSLTYHELNARANQMAHYLRRLGVGPETVVGLCLDRSLEMVIDILAILKAGGAYLPLESQYPEERLSRMVEGSGAEVVIGLSGIEQKFGRSVETLVLRNELVEKIAGESRENLKSEVGGENLAYVIFTSGSTGRPKGIAITQANVARLVKNNDYARFEDEIFLQLATVSFDASIYELWSPLLNGSRLVLYPAERPSLEILGETLNRHQVTTLFLTTALFHLMVEERIDDLRLLNQLIVGGEVTSVGRMKRAITELSGCSMIAAYGPAESTTYTTCGELREAEQVRQTVPIGKPIANTQVYILDRQLQPVPTTVAGELYIGGDGLARGYLNHPELTAERFIPLPFGDSVGGRLYRTGDQVRWMEDGQIEFLGRLDHQVKIRGFRIEPGEIEVVCTEHPEVKEALVLARQVENGGKRLVAYLVAKEGAVLSDSQIRGYLEKRLPDYMVPSEIVLLDEMPLNTNGKIDRGRLPQPELDRERSEREYRQPATETEQALASIWSEVLQVPRVGTADNFFELGGDSIIAIQISARARQAGLHLTPKDIFERRTIAELAVTIENNARKTTEYGPVTGALPLTPIQRWFFEQHLPEPRHFNQSGLFELKRPLETAVIERALSALITHHDALRSRFVKEPEGWRGFIAEPETGAPLTEIDLSGTPTSQLPAAIERRCGETQASLNLAEGPIIRVGLLRLGRNRGDRLFITIHHLAVDIASWGILLEDLTTACDQASRGEEIHLPAKTTSFKRWGELLTELGQKEESEEALDFWLAEKRSSGGDLPVDHADGNNIQASARTVIVELDEEETRRLVHEVPTAYRTQISEVLLAALGTALGEWNGEGKLLVDVEGHGREESAVSEADLTRTVGWFASIYPVLIEARGGPGETLKQVKEELRNASHRGLGYGLVKYLGRTEVAEKLKGLPPARISFNYLGQVDHLFSGMEAFTPAEGKAGPERSPRQPGQYLLDVLGQISEGRLRMRWVYSAEVYEQATIEAQASNYLKELRGIIAHCLSPEAGGYTPSDFPLAKLDQQRLDELARTERQIEDIYPLSPMQQGILFHCIYEFNPELYFQQCCFTLIGELNLLAFERAWQQLVERHPILRTAFVWERLDDPLQVVGRRATLPFEHHDWRTLSPEAQSAALDTLMRDDRNRGFDLSKAPLMRLHLIQLRDRAFRFIWSFHHILIDGWSLPQILGEAFRYYDAFCRGMELKLEPSRPYQHYIVWLQEQDLAAAEQFWRETLRGFSQPTSLGVENGLEPQAAPAERYAQQEFVIPASVTEELQYLARRHQVTMNTLMQGAWALLLSKYSGDEDVLFGAVVSGRPADLEGVEGIAGLFINTLPVRVRFSSDARLLPCLEALQSAQIKARQYAYCPLARIQSWSEVDRGRPLFDTIMAFENLPLLSSPGENYGGLEIQGQSIYGSTNYPISLAVDPGPELLIAVGYDRRRFDARTITQIVGHFHTLLANIAAHPESRVSELQLMTASERERLLVDWNRTTRDYPRQASIASLFELEVEAYPERIALVHGDRCLTYHELNARANQLARHLWRRGVGSETLVGICVERSLEMVVGLLGILKAGGAYVPMDPAYPAERIAFMLENSGGRVLLTQQPMLKGLPASRAEVIALDVEWRKIGAESEENPPSRATAENLAYVIYTSGSTGRPKGVMVTQRGVRNLVEVEKEAFRLGDQSRVLQFASLSFDASVWEIFSTLAAGGRLYVCRQESLMPGEDLIKVLKEEEITTVTLPPTALAVLSQEDLANLQTVIAAGESCNSEIVNRWARGRRFFDAYGPTEATVCSSMGECVAGSEGWPTIGRPIANTRLYILDSEMNPVPVGVSGELYISGIGLARGYLGRSELTAERFLPDAFSPEPGVRFYRTGDLARYQEDGQIEFLGRLDHQVKIRGFRIEPGEIEAVCTEHPEVKEAVVLARRGENGGQRLVAYLVAKEGAVLSDGQIQGYLEKRLPDHMVPSAIVVLEEMPLNTNGKIDRGRLPQPELDRERSEREYRQPATEAEQALAQIWEAVLHVPSVGTADNFFELGGDSILAVQISARARQAELHLTPKDIFECRTIAKLAAKIQTSARKTVDQGLVTGAMPLTPIQRWFFEQHLPEPHHFNQSSLLELKQPLETAVIERALSALIMHHDALRSRFVKEPEGWRGFIAAPEAAAPLTEIDLSDTPTSQLPAAIERRCGEMQASLNLAEGPIIRVGLLRLGQNRGDRLLIAIHHLAVDVVSWGILLEDLTTACDHASRGEEIHLPAKTTSFKRWGELLTELGQKEESEEALDFWLAEKRKTGGQLPVDHPEGDNCEDNTREVSVELEEEETMKLVHEVQKAYRTQNREVLLAALGTALGEWNGEGKLLVDVEGHGREESAVSEADLTRTVGWFTSIYPVLIEARGGPGETLKQVKEELRTAPHRGLGYGLVKYLGRPEAAEKLNGLPPARISFNYLGQVDHLFSGMEAFTPAEEKAGPERSPRQPRQYLLDVLGQISEGRLRMRWVYNAEVYEQATIEAQASNYLKELRGIIAHCLSPEAGGYTPSDFPLAKLDQQRLDELARTERQIEDIYPLSPMQSEMLLHTLSIPESELGVVQLCWNMGADFQIAAFKQAWQQVVGRHSILRTSLYWENLSEPLQIVHKRTATVWEEHDWRWSAPSEQENRIELLLQEDRRRGFDLAKAPVMRLILVRDNEGLTHFIWCLHHLMLDGWSLTLVMSEVLAFYNAVRQGTDLTMEESRPYRDYIAWLNRQDGAQAESFWRRMLNGSSSPTPLFEGLSPAPETSETGFDYLDIRLPEATKAELDALARGRQLTPNTVVQGAWALMLSRYTGCRDIIFGITVSGRPAGLAGVESMVGLFINVLPLRTQVSPDTQLTPWLKSLQSLQLELRQYEYTPRSQAQVWSGVPLSRPLFESVIVYENYPFERVSLQKEIGNLDFELSHSFGTRANTPLTLVVNPGRELQMRIAFDRRRFDAETISRMLGHLKTLLETFVVDSDRTLSEYPMLTEGERRSLMEWSHAPEKDIPSRLNGDLAATALFGDPDLGKRVYILDRGLALIPVGVPGELYLSCRASAETGEKSIPDPFSDVPVARLYPTGRVARRLPDGSIELLGRNGAQAKIRGYWIELEEVEAALLQHPAVHETAVVAHGDRLVAYLAPHPHSEISIQQLRGFLKGRLTDYSLPSDYVTLPALPLTIDGKVDRRLLPEPDIAHSSSKNLLMREKAPHDILEYQLAGIWEDVFDIRPISPTDNFFDLGGSSSLALALISEIHRKLGYDLPLSILFKGATIRDMARTLRAQTGSHSWSALVPIRAGGSKPPFFCVHAAGGNVLGFIHLAQYLDPDRPFYGLQSIGLGGETEPYTRMEEMAAHYLAEVRSAQPEGPYHLGGLSFGGFVAFEMARQLQALGEKVSLLALLDTWTPIFDGRLIFSELLPADDTGLMGYHFNSFRALSEAFPELKEMDLNRQIDFALEHGEGLELLEGSSKEQARRVMKILVNGGRAVRDYVPQRYQGRITIFRAVEIWREAQYIIPHPALGKPEIFTGWGDLTSKPLEILDMPGDHITMMDEPHVRVLAERLNACLDRE